MMGRPITLFTGQWADLSLQTLVEKSAAWGYDGLELACWGDHFDVVRATQEKEYVENQRNLLSAHGLSVHAISNHLVGQAVCDPIDERHQPLLPDRVWGDGDPEGVRTRAASEMRRTAEAAAKLGVPVVTGFTGSPIWAAAYAFPPHPAGYVDAGFQEFADRWSPVLDAFDEAGIKFALEAHPTEIAFDLSTAERALEAVSHRETFGFNYDPSHLAYQGVDYIQFLYDFADRIYHVHMKDVWWSDVPTRSGTFGGHLEFGHVDRAWDFRSIGRGRVDFEEIMRALNRIGYAGPLSIEWEDSGLDREYGAREACEQVRAMSLAPTDRAFDTSFSAD
jgi:sugar phosphate isomerase/epimerase